jgi:hypothetical protein
MFVMTAKVDKKKIFLIVGAIAAGIVGLVLLFGGSGDAQVTAAPTPATNDGRVKFLSDLGWDVVVSPTESGQIKIPEEASEVFDRYNTLQKSQGYDLSQFAGKIVMRYVYQIKNYPGATDPVYATLLIYKDQVIGGDVTDTSAKGTVGPLKMPKESGTNPAPAAPSTPAPTESGNAASQP